MTVSVANLLSHYDYTLPESRIARAPTAQRTASRLLDAQTGLHDRHFADLLDLLQPGDLLIANASRVIHARLFGQKSTGGQIEVLIERLLDEHEVVAQVRASKTPKEGSTLELTQRDGNSLPVTVIGREHDFYRLRFPVSALGWIEQNGHLPLPPYMERQAEASDETRYQTVFANTPGSVAAPTAGLHFDDALLAALQAKGVQFECVTLHVGAGTFQPVRTDNLDHHHMHCERYFIPQQTVDAIHAAKREGRRIISVGTTSLRALEASAQHSSDTLPTAGWAETDIFIRPGFQFKVVDLLITNFHLPKSTLLVLVSAFAGLAHIRQVYDHALTHDYRFFSYGDAMLLQRCTDCFAKAHIAPKTPVAPEAP